MEHIWEIEDETKKEVHSIWNVLTHKYRSKSIGVSFPYATLKRAFKIKEGSVEFTEYERYWELKEKLKGMSLNQFTNTMTQVIHESNEIENNLNFLNKPQYGDHIYCDYDVYRSVWILGYGYDSKNIDPTNLYLMPITYDLSGDYCETIPHSFGDTPLQYFSSTVYDFVMTRNMNMFQCRCDAYCMLKTSIHERLENPEKMYDDWGDDEIIVDKFPNDYVAYIDTRVSYEPVMWGRIDEEKPKSLEMHDKRIEYAIQQRRERIKNLIQQTRCFQADAIIDLFVSFLL